MTYQSINFNSVREEKTYAMINEQISMLDYQLASPTERLIEVSFGLEQLGMITKSEKNCMGLRIKELFESLTYYSKNIDELTKHVNDLNSPKSLMDVLTILRTTESTYRKDLNAVILRIENLKEVNYLTFIYNAYSSTIFIIFFPLIIISFILYKGFI